MAKEMQPYNWVEGYGNISVPFINVIKFNTYYMENEEKSNKMSSILEDNSGGFSSSRVMALLWSVGVFIVWAVGSFMVIYTTAGTATPITTLMTLPGEIVTIVLGFAGLKVVQRFGEK